MEFAILVVSCLTLLLSFVSGFTAFVIWMHWLSKNKSKEAAAELQARIKQLKNAAASTPDVVAQTIINDQISALENQLKTFSKAKTSN